MTLFIGHIEYANCTPIFTALKSNFDCSGYRFVSGVPATLNAMLGRGEIDVSPSSSFIYGQAPDKYYLLPELSISSIGEVKSVFLFSRIPIEKLDNRAIGLTTESDTSVNLLRVILKKGFGFHNELQRTALPLQEALHSFSALLMIGDSALREGMNSQGLYVYDLGKLWYELTGLPFVFALWIVTREAVADKLQEVKELGARLLEAKRLAYGAYDEIAAASKAMAWISRERLVDYWRTISYDLTERHIEGVRQFFRFATELGLLSQEPELRIIT